MKTGSDSSQRLETGCRRGSRVSYHSRYRVEAQIRRTAQYGHADGKEATTVFPS